MRSGTGLRISSMPRSDSTSVRPDALLCWRCETWFSDECFGFNRANTGRRGRHSYCKPCDLDRKRERKAARTPEQVERDRAAARRHRRDSYWRHREQIAEKRVGQNLKSRYGITQDDYDAMLVAQGGRCAICGSTESKARTERFVVDHCHETGKVRGLLCLPCNFRLGHVDDKVWLGCALSYLGISEL